MSKPTKGFFLDRNSVKVLKSILERTRKEELAYKGLGRLSDGLLLRSEEIEHLYVALSFQTDEKKDMLAAVDRKGDKGFVALCEVELMKTEDIMDILAVFSIKYVADPTYIAEGSPRLQRLLDLMRARW